MYAPNRMWLNTCVEATKFNLIRVKFDSIAGWRFVPRAMNHCHTYTCTNTHNYAIKLEVLLTELHCGQTWHWRWMWPEAVIFILRFAFDWMELWFSSEKIKEKKYCHHHKSPTNGGRTNRRKFKWQSMAITVNLKMPQQNVAHTNGQMMISILSCFFSLLYFALMTDFRLLSSAENIKRFSDVIFLRRLQNGSGEKNGNLISEERW